MSIILITHDMGLVAEMADRVVVLMQDKWLKLPTLWRCSMNRITLYLRLNVSIPHQTMDPDERLLQFLA